MEIKQRLRKELKTRITDANTESDAAIAQAVLSSADYVAANTVFMYVGVNNEIATLPILEAALKDGKTVCVPFTYAGGIMDASKIESAGDLTETPRGLFEPKKCNPIPPEDIDLIIVPCLSCDPFGNRIGYGGGYYDRYLKKNTNARKYAVVRKNLLSMHLTHGKNDVRIDGFFTECGLYSSADL